MHKKNGQISRWRESAPEIPETAAWWSNRRLFGEINIEQTFKIKKLVEKGEKPVKFSGGLFEKEIDFFLPWGYTTNAWSKGENLWSKVERGEDK